MINREFWQGKKVFLTGHTGFKGAWAALWLHDMGAEVVGFSLSPPTTPSLFKLLSLDKKIHSIIGDIRDYETLSSSLSAAAPEIVIHMAAQPLVIESYRDPVDTYMTNVIGVANIFEAVKACDTVKTVLNITTDKCYENNEWHWGYRENEPLGGFDPYSSSKACSELVTSTYQRCFFTESSGQILASARAGNVIGGGDWADNRLIPDFLRAISAGNSLVIRSPNSIRPWQHVLEPISGYLTLIERLHTDGREFEGAWNFGPADSDAKPVAWIADKMCALWGDSASWELDDPEKQYPHEAGYLKLDCSKARNLLNWTGRLNLETALQWIIDWHKAYLDNADISEKTLSQIHSYEALRTK